MRVRELMEFLKGCDPDLEVAVGLTTEDHDYVQIYEIGALENTTQRPEEDGAAGAEAGADGEADKLVLILVDVTEDLEEGDEEFPYDDEA